jgi:hypothetical protein
MICNLQIQLIVMNKATDNQNKLKMFYFYF